jgi:signal transduction histidine kinase
METRTMVAALNLRIVLLVYAAAAVISAAISSTVVAAAVFVALALIAIGLSTIPNAVDRRRAFGWFVAAHFLVAPALVSARRAVWPAGVADGMASGWGLAAFMLYYSWFTAFGDPLWLWPRTATRAGALRRSSAELLRTQYEQSIRLAAAQEERNRLARDLHDSVKQQIFAIQTAAATAEARLGGDAAGARGALDTVRASAREAMAEMEADRAAESRAARERRTRCRAETAVRGAPVQDRHHGRRDDRRAPAR